MIKVSTRKVPYVCDKKSPGPGDEMSRLPGRCDKISRCQNKKYSVLKGNVYHLLVHLLTKEHHQYASGFMISQIIGCKPENVRKIISRSKYDDPRGELVKIRDLIDEILSSNFEYEVST